MFFLKTSLFKMFFLILLILCILESVYNNIELFLLVFNENKTSFCRNFFLDNFLQNFGKFLKIKKLKIKKK